MPVSVRWANKDKTVLYSENQGDFSSTIIMESIYAAYQMIEEVDHKVSVIVNLIGHGRILGSLVSSFPDMAKKVHPRTEHTYMVGLEGIPPTRCRISIRNRLDR